MSLIRLYNIGVKTSREDSTKEEQFKAERNYLAAFFNDSAIALASFPYSRL
jgi:hypothetical protein